MTLVTKSVGRLPGYPANPQYDSQTAYGRKQRCIQYGCELESLVDNNTYTPFAWDGDKTFTLDDAHWRLISGNPEVWAAGNPKPATTGTTGDYPYNGMGRVVLAKNMVNVAAEGEPEELVNTLTQDMFYKGDVGSRVPNANTVFVIKYDFVLGEDITVPENCILEFDGGSVSGEHTLTGNNTGINAGLIKIFGTDVTLNGTWKGEGHIVWFGADSGINDNSLAIQKCFNSFTVVIIDWGVYQFSSPLNTGKADVIKAPSLSAYGSQASLVFTANSGTAITVTTTGSSYKYIEGIRLTTPTASDWSYVPDTIAFDTQSGACLNMVRCTIQWFQTLIVSHHNSYYNSFYHCRFFSFKYGFMDLSAHTIEVHNCRIAYFSRLIVGIYGEGPINICDCKIEQFDDAIVAAGTTSDNYIKQVNFFNNYIECEHDRSKAHIIYGHIKSLTSKGNIFYGSSIKSIYDLYSPLSIVSCGNIIFDTLTNLEDYLFISYYGIQITDANKLRVLFMEDVSEFTSVPQGYVGVTLNQAATSDKLINPICIDPINDTKIFPQ